MGKNTSNTGKSTADLVRFELENDLYLLELLREGLINYTALARVLLGRVKKGNSKATVESISVAVKRYVAERKKGKVSAVVKKIIANSQLSTKNDIVHLTYQHSKVMLQKALKLTNKIDWGRGEIFFVNQVAGEVTIILDKKNMGLLKDCESEMISVIEDLALLSVKEIFQEGLDKSVEVPGVYIHFIQKVSRRGIDIIDLISTFSQLTFVLRNEDLLKAYREVEDLVKHFRRV